MWTPNTLLYIVNCNDLSSNVIVQHYDCWLLVCYDMFVVYRYSEKYFHDIVLLQCACSFIYTIHDSVEKKALGCIDGGQSVH